MLGWRLLYSLLSPLDWISMPHEVELDRIDEFDCCISFSSFRCINSWRAISQWDGSNSGNNSLDEGAFKPAKNPSSTHKNCRKPGGPRRNLVVDNGALEFRSILLIGTEAFFNHQIGLFLVPNCCLWSSETRCGTWVKYNRVIPYGCSVVSLTLPYRNWDGQESHHVWDKKNQRAKPKIRRQILTK